MTETADQLKKHIAALTEFEARYGEYIRAQEAEWTASLAAGAIGAPDDAELGPDWSADEWAQRTRALKMLATRADRAIKASGVASLAGSADLPAQAFDFEVNHGYFSDDGLSIPRELLERIPSQISGLEIRLEEAEAAEEESTMRLLGELIEDGQEQARRRRERQEDHAAKTMSRQSAEHAPGQATEKKRPWYENPWLVATGSGLIVLAVTLVLTQT